MNRTPVYDNDLVTKAYVDELIKGAEEKIAENVSSGDSNKNFSSQPTTPYKVNDTWISNGVVYVCIQERLTGGFVASDWKKQLDTSEFEDFIEHTYPNDKTQFESELDSKIETFFTETDPSVEWINALDKEKHVGDLWVKNSNETYIYVKFNEDPIIYQWLDQVVVNKTIVDLTTEYKIKDVIMDWTTEFPQITSGQIVLMRTKYTYKDGEVGYTVETEISGDNAIIQSETQLDDTSKLWLDTNTNELKQFDGTYWIVIAKNYDYIEQNLNSNYYNKTEADELLATEHSYSVETRELSNGLQYRIENVETIVEKGVAKSVTTTSVTINDDGVNVGRSDTKINTTLSVDGVYIKNIQATVAKFTADGSEFINTNLKGQIQECGVIQLEKHVDTKFGNGLAHYYIGG